MVDVRPVSPRVLLVAFVLATAVAVGAGLSSSVTPLDPYNYEWDGGSALESQLDDASEDLVVARSAGAYREADAESTIAIAPVPEWSAGAGNASAMREFVDRGGTVVVAGEGDGRANALLSDLGAETRIDGTQLRDINHYDGSTAVPRATAVTRLPRTESARARSAVSPAAADLVAGVNGVALSNASVLDLPGEESDRPTQVRNVSRTVRRTGATVLLRSSPFGYPDIDSDGRFDVSERLGTYPVVAVEPVDDGRVVVVSDTSLFTNALLEQEGNPAFLRALGASEEKTILDHSEAPAPPLLAPTVDTVGTEPLLGALLGLGGVGVLGLWLVGRRRSSGASRPSPGIGRRIGDRLDAVSAPALVAALLVVGAAVGGGLVLTGVAPTGESPVGDGAATDGTNPHLDPAAADDPANLTLVERRLGTAVERRAALENASLESDGVGATRTRLNSSAYRSLVRGYANVLSRLAADNRSAAFSSLRAEQVAFVTAVDTYWRTLDRYRALTDDESGEPKPGEIGPENGSIADPRRYLAHRLARTWRTVDRTATELTATYRVAGGNLTGNASVSENGTTTGNGTSGNASRNGTGAFADSVRAVQSTREAVNATRREAVAAELGDTSLTVAPRNATASLADPAVFEGRVTAPNGTGVPNGTVRIVAGNRTVTTRTDDAGRFELAYRPLNLPVEPTTLVVAHAPANDSAFAYSSAAVNLSVRTAEPTVSATVSQDTASPGESISITGTVHAGGHGLDAVPYVVTVDGTVVGHGTTDLAGRYDSTVKLPDDVQAGERTVRVSVVPALRTLLPANATAAVRVEGS